ncbi:hypothetical protein OKW43_002782 [Paraburkholderia sp. WC7.3g]|uniref:hypothetical protein n=1 Tax=Paraburkholderia sp. WC7.3g TaxID=2991070 RepID=UPI003D1EEF4F
MQGYESSFNDVTGATPQPIVVDGDHRERDCLGPYVPAHQGGGGDHESPAEVDAAAHELAVLITVSTDDMHEAVGQHIKGEWIGGSPGFTDEAL